MQHVRDSIRVKKQNCSNTKHCTSVKGLSGGDPRGGNRLKSVPRSAHHGWRSTAANVATDPEVLLNVLIYTRKPFRTCRRGSMDSSDREALFKVICGSHAVEASSGNHDWVYNPKSAISGLYRIGVPLKQHDQSCTLRVFWCKSVGAVCAYLVALFAYWSNK